MGPASVPGEGRRRRCAVLARGLRDARGGAVADGGVRGARARGGAVAADLRQGAECYRRTMHGNAARALDPSLGGLFASIDAASAAGAGLAARAYLVCAAVCVAKTHRGQGLLSRLYGRMRKDFATHYDCVMTDIARDNVRSLAAHRRAGFEVCGSQHYDGQTWDLVKCDWTSTAGA